METGTGIEDVTVSIGMPRRRPKGNWECPFLIEGLGKAKIQRVGGVDALQALLLAVEGARVALDKSGAGHMAGSRSRQGRVSELHPDAYGTALRGAYKPGNRVAREPA
jgi:uncharacterized protein DUF6968